MKIKGLGTSRGIVIAKVFVINDISSNILYNGKDAEKELAFYEKVLKKVCSKIQEIIDSIDDKNQKQIFEAHLAIAKDPEAHEYIKNAILNQHKSAIYATNEYYSKIIKSFNQMDDEYFKERANDIKDTLRRFIMYYENQNEVELDQINHDVIVIASNLRPSQTVKLNTEFVKGFATEFGSYTSHSVILAKNMNIPCVVNCKDLVNKVQTGDLVILDGNSGTVIINPDEKDLKKYKTLRDDYSNYLNELNKFKELPSITQDNYKIEILANINSCHDAKVAYECGAEGIGLFRTEFLYLDNDHWPTEQEQFNVYKKILEMSKSKTVIIRTLDIGGDKLLNYYNFDTELNTFLGVRAIRFCLSEKHQDIFKTQLRALIKASKYGNLSIMFPMITTIEEFLKAKHIFIETYNEVKKEDDDIKSLNEIKVGMMIETPAAAILADKFCKYADFVSIGSNDLIQYTMAADRMNQNLSYLYQPLNPSILRMIKSIIDGAHKNNKPVGICGEIAGNRQLVPLLIGLGIDELSMNNSCVLKIREQLSKLNQKDLQKLAKKAIKMEDETQVKKLLLKWNIK